MAQDSDAPDHRIPGAPAPGSPPRGEAAPGRFGAARHPYGPRPLGALIPGLTRPVFRKKSPAGAQLMADWAEVVGPALAAATTPRRLSGGTLTIACAGPVAMELTHLAPQLLARINGHLGRVLVERLRFVQQAQAGGAPVARGAPDAPLPPQVEQAVAAVPGEELRAALAKLGQRVYRNRP
ncbi:DUF721 domain-containing protein [Paracraurococcus ruber]|uniref:DUF721 domain-containing protein n=1 Tax=Paracraurococcus ruber TaxID=77675 RepID=A0ABS1D5V1_9PROT|nr:DciA family protein [Paracraurococcus ruber]MBK1661472.1 hypothetical protein [Paracraurococcus ruber]TDG21327.1 DUF721 domain-containing protein [Paracraurococcus ruber]